MRAKIAKCYSLAIQASSVKLFDPSLRLGSQVIPFVGRETIKFLGGPISVPTNRRQQQEKLESKLRQMLEHV
jgi:hypothetical protein